MANQVKAIIRQHWLKRHDKNPEVRRLAGDMISIHVDILRKLSKKQ